MRLYLVQHGDAVAKDVDPERPLSDQGRADVERLTGFLGRSGIRVQHILHSGKLRAWQTAQLLAPLLAEGEPLEAHDGLSPNDSPETFFETLGDDDVLVAGHMPFVSRAVSVALGLDEDRTVVDFQPGSVAVLQTHGNSGWRLVGFVRPEFL